MLFRCPKNIDFLPDFSAQARCKFLNFIHYRDNSSVFQTLQMQRGDFTHEGKHFAAIVEIPSQIEGSHLDAGRRTGLNTFPHHPVGIFGKLKHINYKSN